MILWSVLDKLLDDDVDLNHSKHEFLDYTQLLRFIKFDVDNHIISNDTASQYLLERSFLKVVDQEVNVDVSSKTTTDTVKLDKEKSTLLPSPVLTEKNTEHFTNQDFYTWSISADNWRKYLASGWTSVC